MRISAPGPTNHQRGFTLLEMMMVLLIIGIATAMASVAGFGDNPARALRKDALRLAQLFTSAQVQARAGGRAIVWQHDARGYEFVRLPRKVIVPARMMARGSQDARLPDDKDTILRARDWVSSAAVTVRGEPVGGVVFDADWFAHPFTIELDSNGQQVRLSRLGNGRFVVVQ